MGTESGEIVVAASSIERRSERKSPPLPKAAPWLVFPYGKGMKNQAFYNICEPYNKTCRKSISELSGKWFWQHPSHQGWLIIICGENHTPEYNFGDCYLWNPLTFETIQLPSLEQWCAFDQSVVADCILSSPPYDANSMVLCLFYSYASKSCDQFFLFCHPGDKEWKMKKLSPDVNLMEDFISLNCFKDKLYAMRFNDKHLEIEIQKVDDGNLELSLREFDVSRNIWYPVVGGWNSCASRYHFVETDDEFFSVLLRYTARGFKKVVSQILVFRLDFSALEWKEVTSLGDHVLFIGTKGTTSCSAAEAGIARGCLYFTLEEDLSMYKFEVESTSNSAILPCLKLPAPWFSPDWIMIPNGGKREDYMGGKDEPEKNVMKAVERRAYVLNNDEGGKHGGKDNGGDLEKPPSWCMLIEDMVESVANRLHRLDYSHFCSVCKKNRALMPMEKLMSTCATRGTHLSPWLMFSRDHGCATFSFVNPMHNNENYFLNLSDLVGAVIRFQKGGWLLMSKEDQETGSLFFYNPFTRETINLPQLPFDEIYGCSGISFSSLPTSSDCVVFAIERKGIEEISFYFIRKGEAFWSPFVFSNADAERYIPLHNTPVIFNGVFYCVDYNGVLGVFNIDDNSWKVLEKPHQQFGAMYPSFLVECGGELLLVKIERYGTLFGIFRLDFNKMNWVRVENLGKHMLFVSYTSCLSAIAPTGRMENKVYFPRSYLNGKGVVCYSLETGSYCSFGSQHSAKDFYDTEDWYANCTWIEPNWLKSTAQELEWVMPPA
ncbi:hypothetical protein MKW98_025112 [Papaver atlanticum]|uniref:KIB1-4 beta-propeller domain-containing protein n=1 Tax=Papaver atlanticum TaxID=357466 RepID=A0AAD4S1F8_9MAGN|nr:hypothetical protein MKW98_025112 [Papaver atlanticum]